MAEPVLQSRLKTGMQAPSVCLTTGGGESIHLSELWPSGPTLLTFLRHFGRLFCREWLAQLEHHQEKYARAGLQTISIAMGQPRHARRYCGKFAPSITCLTDETTLPYRTYALQQGKLIELMSPAVVSASVRGRARGSSVGKTIGDAKMLPGTVVVDTDGIIRYACHSKHAGDHPDIEELIATANTLSIRHSGKMRPSKSRQAQNHPKPCSIRYPGTLQ